MLSSFNNNVPHKTQFRVCRFSAVLRHGSPSPWPQPREKAPGHGDKGPQVMVMATGGPQVMVIATGSPQSSLGGHTGPRTGDELVLSQSRLTG